MRWEQRCAIEAYEQQRGGGVPEGGRCGERQAVGYVSVWSCGGDTSVVVTGLHVPSTIPIDTSDGRGRVGRRAVRWRVFRRRSKSWCRNHFVPAQPSCRPSKTWAHPYLSFLCLYHPQHADYKNAAFLSRFLSPAGRLLPRRQTKLPLHVHRWDGRVGYGLFVCSQMHRHRRRGRLFGVGHSVHHQTSSSPVGYDRPPYKQVPCRHYFVCLLSTRCPFQPPTLHPFPGVAGWCPGR